MIVNITPSVRIRREEPHNWVLEAVRLTKSGKAKWRLIGYHGSLEAAARSLLVAHLDVLGASAGQLNELCMVLNSTAQLIARAAGGELARDHHRQAERIAELEAELAQTQGELEKCRKAPS